MWTNHTSFDDVFINWLDCCIMINMAVLVNWKDYGICLKRLGEEKNSRRYIGYWM